MNAGSNQRIERLDFVADNLIQGDERHDEKQADECRRFWMSRDIFHCVFLFHNQHLFFDNSAGRFGERPKYEAEQTLLCLSLPLVPKVVESLLH